MWFAILRKGKFKGFIRADSKTIARCKIKSIEPSLTIYKKGFYLKGYSK